MILVALLGSALGQAGPTLTISPSWDEPSLVVLGFTGNIWTEYTIQYSTNLVTWQDMIVIHGKAADESGSAAYSTKASKIGDHGFYRARVNGPTPYVSLTLDPSSPLSASISISDTSVTTGVPLAVYDVSCASSVAVIQRAIFEVEARPTTNNDVSAIFSAIRLKVGGLSYLGHVVSTGTGNNGYGWKIEFDNMATPIPANTTVPMTIIADIEADTNGALSGLSVTAGGFYLTDVEAPEGNALHSDPLQQGTTFTLYNVDEAIPSSYVTAVNPAVTSPDGIMMQQFSFSFSLTAGSEPTYVSTELTNVLETTSIGPVGTITPAGLIDNSSSGDTPDYFLIAPGQTKQFTATYISTGNAGTVSGIFRVQSIHYGLTPENLTDHSVSGQMDPGWFQASLEY